MNNSCLKNDPQMVFVLRLKQNRGRKTILKWKYVVRLKQIVSDSMKSDTEMEYFGAPETTRREEKRPWNGIFLCA